MAAERGTEDRLTDGDRERVRAAIEEVASQQPSGWTREQRLNSAELAARRGASAIGCGFADLRQVEEDWIREQARQILAGDR